MIARMWGGSAFPEKAEEYVKHLETSVLDQRGAGFLQRSLQGLAVPGDGDLISCRPQGALHEFQDGWILQRKEE